MLLEYTWTNERANETSIGFCIAFRVQLRGSKTNFKVCGYNSFLQSDFHCPMFLYCLPQVSQHRISFFVLLIVGLTLSLQLTLRLKFLPPIYYDFEFDMETVFEKAIIESLKWKLNKPGVREFEFDCRWRLVLWEWYSIWWEVFERLQWTCFCSVRSNFVSTRGARLHSYFFPRTFELKCEKHTTVVCLL